MKEKLKPYCFTPFSFRSLQEGEVPCLLLQLIINDLLDTHSEVGATTSAKKLYPAPQPLFPFSYAAIISPLLRLEERASLLEKAIPALKSSAQLLQEVLKQVIHRIHRPEKEANPPLLAADGAVPLPEKNPKPIKKLPELKQIFSLLEPYLLRFRSNENLLLFLLQRQHQMCALITQKQLCQLFAVLEPRGIDVMHAYMKQKFIARGFAAIVPVLQGLITDLKELYAAVD